MNNEHFFDMLNKPIDPYKEYKKLKKLFEENIITHLPNGVSIKRLVNIYSFNHLSFRGTYISLEEMEKDLGFTAIKKENFDINVLFCYCEYLYNIIMQSYHSCTTYSNATSQIDLIVSNIRNILENTNHEIYTSPENFNSIIIEKNNETIAATKLIENNNLNDLLKRYLYFRGEGDLEYKRQILNELAREIEPIYKSIKYKQYNIGFIEKDLGYLLNNFHIRHNNNEGSNKNELLDKMEKKEIEEWFDKTYNLILSVIILNKAIQITNEIKEVKNFNSKEED